MPVTAPPPPPAATAALRKARGDWRTRETQLGRNLAAVQSHLRNFAATLADAQHLDERSAAECVSRVRASAARQDALEARIAANGRVVTALTAGDIHAATTAPEKDDAGEPQDALLDLLTQSLAQEQSKGPGRPRLSKEVLKALPAMRQPIEGDRSEDEEDVVVERGELNLICPILRMEMVEPMKSKSCGHSFSKAGIRGHFRQLKVDQAPCPVAGCRMMVSLNDLEPDEDLIFALDRRNRLRQAASKKDVCLEDVEEDDEEETALML